MEENLKQLLLKDLCARLPHKVKIKCDGYPNGLVVTGIVGEQVFHTPYFIGGEIIINKHTIDTIRPYLRPMSSMTEEEREEFRMIGGVMSYSPQHNTWAISAFSPEAYDWLLANHFDHRGLIPIGLAIEAPEDMYK